MFGSLGVTELLIILAIIVVLFGVNKLPKLGKGLGEGIRNFKDSMRDAGREEPGRDGTPSGPEPKDPS